MKEIIRRLISNIGMLIDGKNNKKKKNVLVLVCQQRQLNMRIMMNPQIVIRNKNWSIVVVFFLEEGDYDESDKHFHTSIYIQLDRTKF